MRPRPSARAPGRGRAARPKGEAAPKPEREHRQERQGRGDLGQALERSTLDEAPKPTCEQRTHPCRHEGAAKQDAEANGAFPDELFVEEVTAKAKRAKGEGEEAEDRRREIAEGLGLG